MHSASIGGVANIQVRGVPESVHRRLKVRAAETGRSLNELLLAELAAIAQLPTIPELTERIEERERYAGPPSASVIRAGRAAR